MVPSGFGDYFVGSLFEAVVCRVVDSEHRWQVVCEPVATGSELAHG
jgi:hypothetical protein